MEPSSLREAFREEAADYLDVLGQGVVSLERNSSTGTTLRRMFIAAHSLKASGAIADAEPVCILAHAVEDVLAALQSRPRAFSPAVASLLLDAVEMLQTLVADDSPSQTPTPETSDLIVSIHALASRISETTDAPIPIRQRSEVPIAGHAGRKSRGAARRALVLEDSPTVHLLETMLLGDAGFTVDVFDDPEAALERLAEDSYDLVVTGMETRGLNGLDFVAALRARGLRSLRVIVTDPDDDPRGQQRARDLGAVAYLPASSLRHPHLAEAARKAMKDP